MATAWDAIKDQVDGGGSSTEWGPDPGPEAIEDFMASIRAKESSNRYSIIGPTTKYGRVSGAYQFLKSTWGYYGGYSEAYLAPKAVQDAKAKALMSQYYKKYKSWPLVAVAWFGGPGRADTAMANGIDSVGGLKDQFGTSISQYANDIMAGMKSTASSIGEAVADAAADIADPPDDRSLLDRVADASGTNTSGSINAAGSGAALPSSVAADPEAESIGSGVVVDYDAEAEDRYAEMSDEQFLAEAYQDLLGREGDQAGMDYWLGLLQSGTSRGDIMQALAGSDERAGRPDLLRSDVEQMIFDAFPEYAWLLEDPEIRAILIEAVDPAKGFNAATFASKIRNTKFWQENEASVRQWEADKSMDPAQTQARIEDKALDLQRRGVSLGIVGTDEEWAALAERALKFSFSPNQETEALAVMLDRQDALGAEGAAGSVYAGLKDLRSAAASHLVSLPEKDLMNWSQDIATGRRSIDDFDKVVAGLAKAKFSGNEDIGKLIDQGLTPDAYFADHKRMLANEWDMSDEQVDLMDDRYAPILSSAIDGKVRAMDLAEARKYSRGLDGWQDTTTGKAKVANTTQALLQAFGKVKV